MSQHGLSCPNKDSGAYNCNELPYTPYQKRKSPTKSASNMSSSTQGPRSASAQWNSGVSWTGSPVRTPSSVPRTIGNGVQIRRVSQGTKNELSIPTLRNSTPPIQLGSPSKQDNPPPLKRITSDSLNASDFFTRNDASPLYQATSVSKKSEQMEPPSSKVPDFRVLMKDYGRRTASMPLDTLMDKPTQKLPYRLGFQPKGVVRHRTDEFMKIRAQNVQAMDLDIQRMERRLTKLMTIYSPDFQLSKAPDTAPFGHSRFWQLGSEQVWDIFRSKHEQKLHNLQLSRRSAEQSIVKWQDDDEFPSCCICNVRFSLAVSRHHCRLCGRLVCESPNLPYLLNHEQVRRDQLETWEPCSSLMECDAANKRFRSLPKRPDLNATHAQRQAYESAELYAARFCRECKSVVYQIMRRNGKCNATQLSTLYQKDINEALPDFHEMILGLKKNDSDLSLASSVRDSKSLQASAIQARKELLARFSRYEQLARKIESLPPEVEGVFSATQKRLQQAIFARTTLFLQRNMFPLQGLGLESNVRRESKKKSWDRDDRNAFDHVKEQLHALSVQDSLLGEYIEEAKKNRNLDDIASLKQSQDEIRSEIARLHASHE